MLLLPPLIGINPVQAQSCINAESLVQLSIKDAREVSACDILGRSFKLGLAEPTFENFSDEEFLTNYSAYHAMRLYLAFGHPVNIDLQSERYTKTELTSYLLLAASSLGTISSEREAYYKAYIFLEYWKINEESFGRTRELLNIIFRDLAFDIELKSPEQLDCLILSDVPTLPLEKVWESKLFQDCLKALDKE